MATSLIIGIFCIGYAAIAFEHPLKLNKTASALLTGVLCWTIYAITSSDFATVESDLAHHLSDISGILFFLLGAMTIVELIDAHQGFRAITDRITTDNSRTLLWTLAILSFFLSAVLDNLTTSIVMVSLLRKLVQDIQQRKLYAGMVIIAANSGGAWSPIGDVTTTMLWIGGQITPVAIIKSLFLPSLISLIVPVLFLSFRMKGPLIQLPTAEVAQEGTASVTGSNLMLAIGLGSLLFVPIFKTLTHLPPYMGMLFGLGIAWVASEIIHKDKDEEDRKMFTVAYALSKIDTSSILFFLGILISIACLESMHILENLALWMNEIIGNLDIIVVAIGIASAVIDNVPLVAASIGMYDLATYPTDSKLWELLAYCAGTGGSILIIGSAAGVAVMGMEKIDFIWYLRKISFLALLGYLAGVFTFLALFATLI
jgi:Na+/H+ antiporter NhaD/arsenite permease-like protein